MIKTTKNNQSFDTPQYLNKISKRNVCLMPKSANFAIKTRFMHFKIPFYSLLLSLVMSSCKPTQMFISNRPPADISTLKIARPLVVVDLVSGSETLDTSTQMSIRIEEHIMDALEQVLPKNMDYSYWLMPERKAATIDSCLIVIKNRLLVSEDADMPMPKILLEMMHQDSIPFLLWVSVDGYELTRKTYKWSKTGAIISGILNGFFGGAWYDMPSRGDSRMIGFIVDRDNRNIAFYKNLNIRNLYISDPKNIEKVVINLLDGYFYTYRGGKFEKVKK
jgi:hypothetical protein